jgi:hypothetical protein
MRGRRRDARGALTAAALAITSLLIVAPAANAAFGLTGLSATPASNQAGANTDVTIHLDVQDASADLRDLTIHLPPGLVGNPLAAPQCTAAQLNADACPAGSDVGDVTNSLLAYVAVIPVPLTVSGDLYNLVPQPGEPARFGIRLEPAVGNPIVLQSAARLRQSDFGLDTVLEDLPNQAVVLGPVSVPIDITATELTLNGQVGNPAKGFIRLPTSCGAHTVGFDATAYNSQTASGQATFTTSNCAAVPFSPGFAAKLKPMGKNGLKPELQTTITQTLAEAGLRRAQVVLPRELGADNSVLNNQCSQAQFAAGNCPERTILGSAVAESPLQSEALTGSVALVAPPTPGLPQVGLDLRGPLALKLIGNFVVTEQGTGVVFDGLPDIPISKFQLTFTGGDGGLVLASRPVCDPPLTFSTSFLAHSGASTTGATAATVGGTCKGKKGNKKPKAKVKLGGIGSDRPTLRFALKAGSEKLRSAKLTLPKQLRFASGKSVESGSSFGSKVKVKHTKGGLTIKARKAAKRLSGKIGDGALVAGNGLEAAKALKFKFSIRDAAGKTTKLTVRVK